MRYIHDEKQKESVGQPLGIAARIFGRGIFMMRKWVVVLVILSLVGIVLLSGCTGQQSTTTDYYQADRIQYPTDAGIR